MASDPKRDLIEDIRQGFGFDTYGRVVNNRAISNLESSLHVISDQLNSDLSHFLHEFVQNADDLSYDSGVDPLLSFEIADGQLIISSNEKGFTSSDVDAICSVAKSTKINNRDTTGEKGIGFKSLFKAAYKVTISSNGFHFQFDRTRHCGIVVPEWKEFPSKYRRPHHEGKTVFLVEFSSPEKAFRVLRDVRSLEPQILLFLRRLRKIEIIDQSNRVLLKDITRIDGMSVVSLTNQIDGRTITAWTGCRDWRLFRQTIPITTDDSVRQGIKETEVILAFPLSVDAPRGYAFNILPIAQTSFPFFIQADFILSASREGLDQVHQPWNHALMKGLAQAFVKAVMVFGKDEHLKYIWPRYLPVKEDLSQFAEVSHTIRFALKMTKVLLSAQLSLDLPSQLCYVPELWRDDKNQPLFRISRSGQQSLSTGYADEMLPHLQWLGVATQDAKGILSAFKQYLNRAGGEAFQAQPVEWHERLANALLQFNASQLHALPIVPVQDSLWIDAKSETIIFPQCSLGDSYVEIPPGLPTLRVLRKGFADDKLENLKELYFKIGVKPGTLSETCEAIRKAHAGTRPPTTDPQTLILHAYYLFQGWIQNGSVKVVSKTNLWVANLDKQAIKSRSMYQDETVVSKIPLRYAKGTASERNLMHPGYLQDVPSTHLAHWSTWLSSAHGVFTSIRICSEDETSFTPEFVAMQTLPAPAFLQVLSQAWIQNFGTTKPAEDTLHELMSMKKAWTSEKIELELRETFLEREVVAAKATYGVPYLAVSDPEDAKWDFLGQLGVVVEENLDLWLSGIRYLKKGEAATGPLIRIYHSIYQYSRSDGERIKRFFDSEAAIYISSSNTWVRTRECLWRSTTPFRYKCVLALEYPPDLEVVFKSLLGIQDVKADDVIYELRAWTPDTDQDLEYLRSLLLALSTVFKENKDRFKNDRERTKLNALRNRKLMPLVKRENGQVYRKRVSLDDTISQWFMVDTNRHKESFAEKVWVADFPPEQSLRLKTLIDFMRDTLRNDKPLLSTMVTEVSEYSGHATQSANLTTLLRGRSGYIGCIACRQKKGLEDLGNKIKLLNNCTVNLVSSISTRMTLNLAKPPGAKIQGVPRTKDQVMLKESAESLDFYITEKAAGKNSMPLATGKQLSGYLSVTADKFKLLIHETLSADEGEEARDILVTAGIDIDPEADSIQEANRMNARFQGSAPETPSNGHSPINGHSRGPNGTQAMRGAERVVPTRFAPRNSAFPSVLTPEHQQVLRNTRVSLARPSEASGTDNSSEDWWNAAQTGTQFNGHGHPAHSIGSYTTDPIFPRGPPRRRPDNQYDPTQPAVADPQVAIEGEFAVYNFLKDIVGDSFGPDNWTSELREFGGPDFTRWTPPDAKTFYADFTFDDQDSVLADYLVLNEKIKPEYLPAMNCLFHIEVKSTKTGGLRGKKEGFEMSEWQFTEMQKMSYLNWPNTEGEVPARDVFLVLRVGAVGSEDVQIEVLTELWREIVDGKMGVRFPGGVVVGV